jgi:hypothetical protein
VIEKLLKERKMFWVAVGNVNDGDRIANLTSHAAAIICEWGIVLWCLTIAEVGQVKGM